MANAPEDVLCEAMKRINPAPYKKLFGPEKARLHALLAAADEVRSVLGRMGRKNQDGDLARLDEAHQLKLNLACAPKRRRSPKREKIALHEGVIRQLAVNGYSLRQMAAYLLREVKLKVSHTFLRQCCLEMGITVFERKRGAVQ